MPGITASWYVLVACAVVYTTIAVVTDWRIKRIPNKLTMPMFAAGWIYQIAFHGWPGVGDGLMGFVVGFGVLFVLFAVGGSGAGDVKLIGALSVWLGYRQTILVMISSTIAVVLLTFVAAVLQLRRDGFRGMRKRYLPNTAPSATPTPAQTPGPETVVQRQNRRIMAYAIPVAFATWGVLAWQTSLIVRKAQAPQRKSQSSAPISNDILPIQVPQSR